MLLVRYLRTTLHRNAERLSTIYQAKLRKMRNNRAYKDVMRYRKTQKTRVLSNTGRKTKSGNQRLLNWGARRAAFRPYSARKESRLKEHAYSYKTRKEKEFG